MKVNPKTSTDVNKLLQDKTVSNAKSTEASEIGKNSKLEKNKEVITQGAKDQSAKIDLSPRAQEMRKAKTNIPPSNRSLNYLSSSRAS